VALVGGLTQTTAIAAEQTESKALVNLQFGPNVTCMRGP
jgi:hypothetical protein